MAAGTTMTGTVIGYNGAVFYGGQTVFLMEGYSLMLAQYPFMERKQFQRKLQLPRF
jgi:hypothetical protein